MEEVLIFRAKFKVLGLIPVLKCPTGRNFLPWKLRETANLSDRRNINSPSLTKTLPQIACCKFLFLSRYKDKYTLLSICFDTKDTFLERSLHGRDEQCPKQKVPMIEK